MPEGSNRESEGGALLIRSTGFLVLVLLATLFVPPALPEPALPHVPHAQIIIEGNDDLTPENGIVGGTGTTDDPYRISGWAIASPAGPVKEGAIRISNTSMHVVISDNLFTAPMVGIESHGSGVVIAGASNITISGNLFRQVVRGVMAIDSEEIHIKGNQIISINTDWLWVATGGSSFIRTSNSSFTKNAVTGFVQGFGQFHGARDNVIANNTFRDTGPGQGIAIYAPSAGNEVVSNRIFRHSGVGISAYGDSTRVAQNVVEDAYHGMWLGGGMDNDRPSGLVVEDNTIRHVTFAVKIHCDSCVVAYNLLSDAEWFIRSWGESTHQVTHNLFEGPGEILDHRLTGHNNSFLDAGLRIKTSTASDLRYNWWGSPDGPEEGVVVGGAPVTPWLTTEPAHVGPRT